MGDREVLKSFFEAKTVAVIGAAREGYKVGNTVLRNLLSNSSIRVFPVNPNADFIMGKQCYKSVLDIPERTIDLAIIIVKAELVPEVMKEIAKKKIKSVLMITAGFSEAGNSQLEEKVFDIAKKSNINIIGPNVLGFIAPYSNINASFFQGMPEKGGIAFFSQSGALGVGVLDLAIKEKIGFSSFVSLGNCLNMDFSDFIEYACDDKNTKVIGLYIESLKETKGKRFIEVCKRCKKPIIAIKAGKSEEGKRAAQSHTASIASEKGIYEGIFKQVGIIEVENISELLRTAQVIEKYGRLGKRACVITNAGGLGVLSSDYCARNNISLPQLPKNILNNLNALLPPGWSHNNPIDVLGDALADRYEGALNSLDKEDFFDFFIVLLTPQYMTQPEKTSEILSKLKKPVFACFFGGKKVDAAKLMLRNKNLFVFDEISDLVKVVGNSVL